MTTIRTHKEVNYSVIDNEPINDKRLSWGAKGILIYLLSKPDDWQIYAMDLVKHSTDGKSAVYARLKELEECGYLHREKQRDAKGHLYWVSHIYETPAKNPHVNEAIPNSDCPNSDYPDTVNPDTVNRTLVSTEVVSTEETTTTTNDSLDVDFGNICKVYENEIGSTSNIITDKIKDMMELYPKDWITDAIGVAAVANVRKLNYVEGILKRWKIDGKQTYQDDKQTQKIKIGAR